MKGIIAAVVLATLFLAAGCSRHLAQQPPPPTAEAGPSAVEPGPPQPGTEIGDVAPNFTLSTPQGDKLSLSELRGKAVFINFWASWCEPCKQELPDIQKIGENAGDKLVVLAVNVGEKPGDAQRFLTERRLQPGRILLDADRTVFRQYRVLGLPTSYFIDKDGIIRDKWFGVMRQNDMQVLVGRALAGRSAP